MQFNGKDAISNSTKVASRSLLSVSAIVIFVLTYGVPVEKVSFLGIEFSGIHITQLFPIFLGFLLLNHIVHWVSDLASFRAWNLVGHSPDVQAGWGASSLTTKLELTLERVRFAEEALKKMADLPREQDQKFVLKEALEYLGVAQKKLASMGKEVIIFDWYARFYVYIWYGLVPVFAASAALYLSLMTELSLQAS
jgi:hypothetical protein